MYNIRITDDDFKELIGFKNGQINIDYSSAILLSSYLDNKTEWLEAIRKKEEIDFEYRSYMEFSESLFHQMATIYEDILNKKMTYSEYLSSFNQLIVLGAQLDIFSKEINSDIKFEQKFSELRDKFAATRDIASLRLFEMDEVRKYFMQAQRDSVAYVIGSKTRAEERIKEINSVLPSYLHKANSNIVDIIQEKQNMVRERYSSVNIVHYYDNLKSAIASRNKRAVMEAYEEFINHCDYLDSIDCSPFIGNLRSLFDCNSYGEICRKFTEKDYQDSLCDIDIYSRKCLEIDMNYISITSKHYIENIISVARSLNLLPDAYILDTLISDTKNDINSNSPIAEPENENLAEEDNYNEGNPVLH